MLVRCQDKKQQTRLLRAASLASELARLDLDALPVPTPDSGRLRSERFVDLAEALMDRALELAVKSHESGVGSRVSPACGE